MDKARGSTKPDGSQLDQEGDGNAGGGSVDLPSAAEALAEYVIRNLASSDETLAIMREVLAPTHVRLSVKCRQANIGRLIGKGGKTISSLRLLVRGAAQRQGKRVDVEIVS